MTATDERKASLLRRLFPARQILIRDNNRVRQCTISSLPQIFLLFLFLALGAWSITATLGWRGAEKSVAQREEAVDRRNTEIEETKASYQQAFRKIEEYQSIFSNAACEMSEIHRSLSVIAEKGMAPGETGDDALPRLKSDLSGCRAAGAAAIAIAGTGNAQSAEEEAVRAQIARLDAELKKLRGNHAAFLMHAANIASLRISQLERVLASVGINIKTVADNNYADISPIQPRFGRGGPYISLHPFSDSAAEGFAPVAIFNQRVTRLGDLNTAIRVLPLSEPLAEYEVTSPYGRRNDPLNFLSGIHEGLDMGAPTGAPTLSTGGGVVTYAGWRDRYGYLVEIDHGMGITTRYAHLSKVLSTLGQEVKRGDVIGLVGSTGRSTGPHLHYEVRVNDRATNPTKFITAGRNVLTSQ